MKIIFARVYVSLPTRLLAQISTNVTSFRIAQLTGSYCTSPPPTVRILFRHNRFSQIENPVITWANKESETENWPHCLVLVHLSISSWKPNNLLPIGTYETSLHVFSRNVVVNNNTTIAGRTQQITTLTTHTNMWNRPLEHQRQS